MSVLAALLDLVLPRLCVACGGVAGPLCPRCLPTGPPMQPIVRAATGGWAAADYDGAVRTALLAYKERGRRDLATPLAVLLARAVRAVLAGQRSPPKGAVLVPVPSARGVAAARGGDHMLRLARHAAPECGTRVVVDALRIRRAIRDSAGLGAAERAANLAGAFAARPALPGRAVVVVDDIVTTGVTLDEATRALRAAEWPVLGAAVVAATPRRVVPICRVPYPLALHSGSG